MKYFFLVLMAVFSVTVFADTVSKNSAAFAFPPAVGVTSTYAAHSQNLSFTYNIHSGLRSVIGLSWTLPEMAERATVSVYNLSGTKIKSFPISMNQTSVNWDISGMAKPANGVYLATLTSGQYKKNLQILISR
jgi:hypothetical protein